MRPKVMGMKTDFYVYVHKRKTDGVVFYVGKGRAGRAYSGASRNRFWHNVVNKHGVDVEIIEDCLLEVEAFSIEMDLIAKYRADGIVLVNQTDGGEGVSGFQHSSEFKAAASERNKGNKYNLGRKLTEEHKLKISLSSRQISEETKSAISLKLKSVAKSEETKARMSAAQKGRIVSAETRAKMRAAKLGRKLSLDAVAKLRSRVVSKETREKIGLTSTGRYHTPETCAKIKANHWRKKTKEQQAAVAAACSFNQENAVATGTNFKGA